MKQRVLCLLGSIGVVLAMSTISAQGQIIGELEANIPFTFHAGRGQAPTWQIHHPRSGRLGSQYYGNRECRYSHLRVV